MGKRENRFREGVNISAQGRWINGDKFRKNRGLHCRHCDRLILRPNPPHP